MHPYTLIFLLFWFFINFPVVQSSAAPTIHQSSKGTRRFRWRRFYGEAQYQLQRRLLSPAEPQRSDDQQVRVWTVEAQLWRSRRFNLITFDLVYRSRMCHEHMNNDQLVRVWTVEAQLWRSRRFDLIRFDLVYRSSLCHEHMNNDQLVRVWPLEAQLWRSRRFELIIFDLI